jgi:hypothetical protein
LGTHSVGARPCDAGQVNGVNRSEDLQVATWSLTGIFDVQLPFKGLGIFRLMASQGYSGEAVDICDCLAVLSCLCMLRVPCAVSVPQMHKGGPSMCDSCGLYISEAEQRCTHGPCGMNVRLHDLFGTPSFDHINPVSFDLSTHEERKHKVRSNFGLLPRGCRSPHWCNCSTMPMGLVAREGGTFCGRRQPWCAAQVSLTNASHYHCHCLQ